MNSVLALSDRERAELFSATARKLGFSNEAIAEKDFWVCWTLGQLFQGIPAIGDRLKSLWPHAAIGLREISRLNWSLGPATR